MDYKDNEQIFPEPLPSCGEVSSFSCNTEIESFILQIATEISGKELNSFIQFYSNPELINATLLNVIISGISNNFQQPLFKRQV